MTSEIRRVFVTIGENQVVEGFYTFDDSTVLMTYFTGEPVLMDGNETVTATCKPELADAVARQLTKRIRRWALGETVDGFSRALKYENEAFA